MAAEPQQVIVIRATEDGEHYVNVLDEADFVERLNTGYYDARVKFYDTAEVISSGYSGTDLNSMCGMIVIRGKIVKPVPEQVIQRYKLS
jgi:hypothetical protein